MAAGLHPNYLTMLTGPNGSPAVKNVMAEMEAALHDKTLDMSAVMQYLGRKALVKVGTLLDSQNERIVLDSAKELLDRSPETQKTTKFQVDSFTLDGQDVAALISALTESAKVSAEHAAAANGLNEVIVDNFERPTPAVPMQQTPSEVAK